MPFRGSAWTMIATALLLAFFIKGLCDYLGNYLVSYAGFASVTRLRNAVFDKVLKQGAEFFEAHSTGQLMSSIMNDVDKVQVATSQILADLLRQFFSAVFLLVRAVQQRSVAGADLPGGGARRDAAHHAHGPAHPPHQPQHAGAAGGDQPDSAGDA